MKAEALAAPGYLVGDGGEKEPALYVRMREPFAKALQAALAVWGLVLDSISQ